RSPKIGQDFPRRVSRQPPAQVEPCRNGSAAFFNLSASARSMSICICSAVSLSPLASLKSTFSRTVLSAGVKPAKLDGGKPQNRRLWKRFQRRASLPERHQRAVICLINSLVASSRNGHSRSNAHQ